MRRRCIGDADIRAQLLLEAHASQLALHTGEGRTYDLLAKYYSWPGMYADVQEYVRCCDTCQKVKHSNKTTGGLLQPLDIPDKP